MHKNQEGTNLILSGSVLFRDVSCSYENLTTVYRSYYDPVLDSSVHKLVPFNPDTSTIEQVQGDGPGSLLVELNFNTTGMTSRYIYLDKANEGEIFNGLTEPVLLIWSEQYQRTLLCQKKTSEALLTPEAQ